MARDTGTHPRHLEADLEALVAFGLGSQTSKRGKAMVTWRAAVRFRRPRYDVLGGEHCGSVLDRLWNDPEPFDPATSEDRSFGLRMSQLLLRRSQYIEFQKEFGQLMMRYLSKSRMERVTATDGELETITLLVGIDA